MNGESNNIKTNVLPASMVYRMTPTPHTSMGSASYGRSLFNWSGLTRDAIREVEIYLWSHIRQTATSFGQRPRPPRVFQLEDRGEAEVRDLERSGDIQEEVFRFKIPVAYTFSMDIILGARKPRNVSSRTKTYHPSNKLIEVEVCHFVADTDIGS
jgi:hypothetical protein